MDAVAIINLVSALAGVSKDLLLVAKSQGANVDALLADAEAWQKKVQAVKVLPV